MIILFIGLIVAVTFLVLYKPQYRKMKSKSCASSWQNNKQKGDEYEWQIFELYRQQGYKVYPKGLNEGRRDKGIDLVAHKGNETVLIQCKNWENSQVKQEHLRIFLGDCTAYLEQNQKFLAKKSIRRAFVTSCENMDYGVKKFLDENNMEYRIIPYTQQNYKDKK